jgi:two-component system CheB/CheR fusion protein
MSEKAEYIITLGSSEGGLEPLKHFFEATTLDQVSYVLLSHLSINYKTELKDILKKNAGIQMLDAEDEMMIEKNKVYILPANKMMVIEQGKLYLMERNRNTLYPNWPIDIFMQSLAEDMGEKTIAVILSGSGTDGTKGAAAIKEAGGMVLAQSPESCQHFSMPFSAIKSGKVDHILDPLKMPEAIQLHVQEKLNVKSVNQ